MKLRLSDYEELRVVLLNETARLVHVPPARLSITEPAEVIERSDSTGLIDVEVVFSAPHEAAAVEPSADGKGLHARREASAAEAAQRLVDLGRGRLSYELRVPISKVELLRLGPEEMDRTGEEGASDGFATGLGVTASVMAFVAIVGLASWHRRRRQRDQALLSVNAGTELRARVMRRETERAARRSGDSASPRLRDETEQRQYILEE